MAKSIAKTLHVALEKQDLSHASLLIELGRLAERFPDDSGVRHDLAFALFLSIAYAGSLEETDTRRFVDGLRRLNRDFSQDIEVREKFAQGLYGAMVFANQEGRLDRRDKFLDELRALAKQRPVNETVREQFGTGLLMAVTRPREPGDDFQSTMNRSNLWSELLNEVAELPRDHQLRREVVRRFPELVDSGFL